MTEQEFNKVIERIYFLPSNWIGECFKGNQNLIDHFSGKWNWYTKNEDNTTAFFHLWLSFDLENRTKFYNYIINQINK